MATAERKGKKVPAVCQLDHFEKVLEGPCPNHAYPVKYAYKDCSLMKRFLSRGSNRGIRRRSPTPW
jgi:hypothetical protein